MQFGVLVLLQIMSGKRMIAKMIASLKDSENEGPQMKRPASSGAVLKRPSAAVVLKKPAATVAETEEEEERPNTQIVPYGTTRSRNKNTWFESHKSEMSEDVLAAFAALPNTTANTNFINNAVVELPTGEKYWQLDNPRVEESPTRPQGVPLTPGLNQKKAKHINAQNC